MGAKIKVTLLFNIINPELPQHKLGEQIIIPMLLILNFRIAADDQRLIDHGHHTVPQVPHLYSIWEERLIEYVLNRNSIFIPVNIYL